MPTPTPPDDPRELQRRILERIAHGHALRRTLDELCLLVDAMSPNSLCSVMLLDEAGELRFESAPGVPREAWGDFDGLVPGELAGSCGTAVHTRAPVVVEDTATDPRWERLRPAAERHGIRGCWSIPLIRDEEVLGSFAISRLVVGGPDREQLELLRSAANLAGLALGRALDERRLSEQANLLHSLLESAADPIFAKDLAGRYLLANAAEACEVAGSTGCVVGRTDEELYGAEVAARVRAEDREVIERGETLDFQSTFESRELGPRTYHLRKSPLRDAEGKTCGVVGVARDVTTLERAEAMLHEAERAPTLAVLAGGVAHDFNNLLTAVIGNCALALEQVPRGSALFPLLAEIEHAAQRAVDLTEQLLAYAGRAELHTRPVALGPLVEEVIALLGSSLARRTRVDLRLCSGAPPVEGDPTQLRQVVLNLVSNASEALQGNPGHVQVRLQQEGDQVVLEVRDDGVGMDDRVRARVFEPFFSTKVGGRGLGLAAAAGIVQGHGGTIECSSEPGQGTTFRVSLPCNESQPDAIDPPGSAGLVLVADDQRAVRSLARRVLEAAGHRVLEAEDGDEALALAREHAHELDLLLLDVRMPGLPGDEVLARLRAEQVATPALLSSGFGEHEIRTGPGAQTCFFLKKPYRPRDLLAAVLQARGG